MNVSYKIAKQYFFTKKNTSAANFINITAIIGILIGTAALFIILSIFSGLGKLTIDMLFTKNATIKIEAVDGKTIIYNQAIKKQLQAQPYITNFSSSIEEKVQLMHNSKAAFIVLHAVDDQYIKNNLDSIKLLGKFQFSHSIVDESSFKTLQKNNYFLAHQEQIALDLQTALSLEIQTADSLSIYVPKKGEIKINKALENFEITQTQLIGYFNSDTPSAYVPLKIGQQLLQLKEDEVYAIDIQHTTTIDDEEAKEKLTQLFDPKIYKISTKKDQIGAFYKMMQVENLMTYLIFTLILIISTFNLIGSIIILIIEKQKDLKTLHAIGLPFKAIKQIFFIEGLLITSIGGIIGFFLGLSVVLAQKYFNLITINDYLPYPVEINWINILIVILTVSIVGWSAAKLGTLKLNKDLLKK